MERFSTHGLSAARKVAYWNSLNNETFTALDVIPWNADAFDGELRRETIGTLTLIDVRSSAVRICHTRSHIARATVPTFNLLAPLRGQFELHNSAHRTQLVSPGEFCLIDHGEPYELRHSDAVRTICLDIPRSALQTIMPNPEATVGRVLRGQSCASRLLAAMMKELGTEIGTDVCPPFAASLAQGLLGLVAAAYSDVSKELLTRAETRRSSLLALVDARLSDPSLAPADIAGQVGISERRLRVLMAEGGESFTTYVLRRRLEHCAVLLQDPIWAGRSITEIAFRSGFNNATHFGHVFKRRFGRTPRESRSDR
ncbi:MAG: helix-turn-helix domain-containing protein [Pseudomonadota bacterium]